MLALLATLLCLPLVLAGGAPEGAPGTATESPRFLEKTWSQNELPRIPQRPVWELRYVATGATSTPLSIYVAPPSAGTIETRWHFPAALASEPATFDAASRLLVGSGAHAFHYVLPQDVLRGQARIAYEDATLVQDAGPFVLFQTPTAAYAYAKLGGILLWAQSVGGTTLQLVGLVPHETLPSLSPGLAPVASQDAADDGALRVACGNTLESPLGGRQDCHASFSIRHGARVAGFTPTFPEYAEGSMSANLHAEGQPPYYAASCAGNRMGRLQQAEACAPADVTTPGPAGAGEHAAEGSARFSHCLNPTVAFKCAWAVTFKIEDE